MEKMTVKPIGEIKHRKVMLVDGNTAVVRNYTIAGKCHNCAHEGYLTGNLMKKHNCLEKKCWHFEKFADSPYWVHIENKRIQDEKEKAKSRAKAQLKRARILKAEQRGNSIKETAEGYIKKYKLPILITRVAAVDSEDSKSNYIINYVSDDLYNDWYEYRDLSSWLSLQYRTKIFLKHLKLPDGRYASIDDWIYRRKVK